MRRDNRNRWGRPKTFSQDVRRGGATTGAPLALEKKRESEEGNNTAESHRPRQVIHMLPG